MRRKVKWIAAMLLAFFVLFNGSGHSSYMIYLYPWLIVNAALCETPYLPFLLSLVVCVHCVLLVPQYVRAWQHSRMDPVILSDVRSWRGRKAIVPDEFYFTAWSDTFIPLHEMKLLEAYEGHQAYRKACSDVEFMLLDAPRVRTLNDCGKSHFLKRRKILGSGPYQEIRYDR